MASTAENGRWWRRQRRVRPIAPDAYERLLATASVLLLAAVAAALARGAGAWDRVPGLVWAHLATIAVALALTPVMMLRRRGDARHRRWGRVWVAAMLATALISFGIRSEGGWSWIHLLSIGVTAMAALVWITAARHDVAAHRGLVRGLTTGALLIAGVFTFPFDRLLGHWLFG